MSTPPDQPEPTDPQPEPDPPVFEPALYYRVTARDVTPACVNFEKVFVIDPCYSNGGHPRVGCGMCGKDMVLLSGQLLDPQPEVS
ncbi:hypothetical protein KQY30_20185 [Streptomyces sp. GMY02]|uniref:hypothetical protein n=1 Tax=Streptomyces sp. GMY02 TaxID=1333528 RepID=UPI001C2BF5FE|nr:hypothetical protein [Streptomyces sp. GMY02]QXE36218.1 hypothetical protein KQY30_20185 [Streptomyces sp. GMY02]